MFPSRAANLAIWAALALAVVARQVVCLARRPRLPTLGDALTLLGSSPAGRFVLAAAWIWFGWHVFVRGAW